MDVLVVGAGPAGLAATNALVSGGASVLMVDMRRRLGSPLRCAELTSPRFFSELGLAPHKTWIRWILKEPKGLIVLNRPRLESDAAEILAARGAVVRPGTSVVAVGPFDGEGRAVTLHGDGQRTRLKARMIIAADGVASRVSCMAGINKPLKLAEMASCLAWRFKDVKLPDPYKCETSFPQETHPFYTSVIPSGPDEALIGLGLLSSRGHACRPTLERVMKRYPYMQEGRLVQTVVGFVPSAFPLAKPFSDGLLVAGTAARLVDAANGAGIEYAAVSGKIAAQVYLASPNRSPGVSDLAAYGDRLKPLHQMLLMSVGRRWASEQAPATRPR